MNSNKITFVLQVQKNVNGKWEDYHREDDNRLIEGSNLSFLLWVISRLRIPAYQYRIVKREEITLVKETVIE